MFKIAVGHQVTSPAVSDLVSDQIDKRTIAGLMQENDNTIFKVFTKSKNQT